MRKIQLRYKVKQKNSLQADDNLTLKSQNIMIIACQRNKI